MKTLLYTARQSDGNTPPLQSVVWILAIWIDFSAHGNLYLHGLLDCQHRDECWTSLSNTSVTVNIQLFAKGVGGKEKTRRMWVALFPEERHANLALYSKAAYTFVFHNFARPSHCDKIWQKAMWADANTEKAFSHIHQLNYYVNVPDSWKCLSIWAGLKGRAMGGGGGWASGHP
jgi:hypothetical protein